jgi:F-type H+-transporting ATPase subunit delta
LNRSDPAARSYANALIDMARERGRIGAIMEDLHAVLGVFHAERKVWSLFTSPRIDREEKEAMVRRAFAGRVGAEVMGLLVVLVRKSRETIFDNIVDQFVRFKDVAENRLHVFVRGARPLEAGVKSALEAAVAEVSGMQVVLHEATDPALLAGLVVRVGDVVVDGSLRAKLRGLGGSLAGERR